MSKYIETAHTAGKMSMWKAQILVVTHKMPIEK